MVQTSQQVLAHTILLSYVMANLILNAGQRFYEPFFRKLHMMAWSHQNCHNLHTGNVRQVKPIFHKSPHAPYLGHNEHITIKFTIWKSNAQSGQALGQF